MKTSSTRSPEDNRPRPPSPAVYVTDVMLRDGLQNQPVAVNLESKLLLLHSLQAAGVTSAEITSFVSPRAVPQMADAAELMRACARVPMRLSALAPNLKGLERAAESGAKEVAVVLSATDTMNRRNINMSLEQALQASVETLAAARRHGLRTRAYIAVAFACPFEGPVTVAQSVALAARLRDAEADEIVIADTIGAASPGEVERLLASALKELAVDRVGLHFHDTRGMGVANAYAALRMGVRRFDASTGGVGGCPFAPGASGNIATEDLVLMAEQSGYDTGISLPGLMATIDLIGQVLGHAQGGRSTAWLRRDLSRRTREMG